MWPVATMPWAMFIALYGSQLRAYLDVDRHAWAQAAQEVRHQRRYDAFRQ
jgi:hypothetical protein